MLRRFEKKLNAWIIELLVAGTTKLEEQTDEQLQKDSSVGKIKNFFKEGIDQMSKDLVGIPTENKETETGSAQ